MADQFKFSSAGQAPEAAFETYKALYSHGSDVARGSAPFHAEIRAWRLDKILLFERRLSGVVHSRRERIASDGYDHVVLTLVISGELLVGAPSPLITVGAGDLVLFDTTRPMQTEARNAHLLTASVARDVVEAALGAPRRLHGRVLNAPANLVLADFLTSLARRADDLAPSALPALRRAFVDILASVEVGELRPGRENRRVELARRETVHRYVARHLSNPDLSVEAISAGTGISRSSLYRLFEKQGGVARFIQLSRLNGLRSALDDGDQAPPAELARTFGFAGEVAMNRQFAEAYGCDPEAYRESAAKWPPDAPALSKRRWVRWMNELD